MNKTDSYLWQNIVATLFCCLPLGIVGIIYASKVDSHYAAGNYHEAEVCAAKSKQFFWISFGIGAAITLAYFVFVMMAGAETGIRP